MSWPVPERREKLLVLWRQGLTYREIAAEYGGTPNGVRSTIRKMREREDPLAMPLTKSGQALGHLQQLKELGLSYREIAERSCFSKRTIERVLR